MRRPRVLLALAVVLSMVVVGAAACGDDDDGTPDIRVEGAIIPAPAGANGALYFDLINDGDAADRLLGATTDVADDVEVHETVAGDDGLSRMVHVDEIEVGPGETVELAPGGLHVMLLGVEPLEEGDTVAVELQLERSGTLAVEVPVGSVGDVAP